MKNTLLLGLVLCVGSYVYADPPSDKEVLRSSLTEDVRNLGKGKSFFDKCMLAAEGLGAGGFAAICGGCCIMNAAEANSAATPTLMDKTRRLCMACMAFIIGSKVGGYSLDKLKEALGSEKA